MCEMYVKQVEKNLPLAYVSQDYSRLVRAPWGGGEGINGFVTAWIFHLKTVPQIVPLDFFNSV